MCVHSRGDKAVTDTQLQLQARIRHQRLRNAGIPSLPGRTSPNVKQQDNKKTMESHDSLGSPACLLNGVRNGSVDDRWRERPKSRGVWGELKAAD